MAEKVILAYSGGLDTSVAIRWIKEKYRMDVITLTIDVGNSKDFEAARIKALKVGAIKAIVIDAKDMFVNTSSGRLYRQMRCMKDSIRWRPPCHVR